MYIFVLYQAHVDAETTKKAHLTTVPESTLSFCYVADGIGNARLYTCIFVKVKHTSDNADARFSGIVRQTLRSS